MAAVMGGMTAEEIMRLAQGGAQAPATKAQEPGTTARAQLAALDAPVDLGSRGAPTAAPTAAPTSGPTPPTATTTGRPQIEVPDIQVEEQTIVPRIDPSKVTWTGTEDDKKIRDELREKYNWTAPERGTAGYSGMFGGTPGTAHGLGYRNDNPIDYSTQGAGLWSMGIDPNDPALGYHVASFKKREADNWAWANSEYWKNNKRTGNEFADDITVLDWYWRDLARRMDKSNKFMDSFIGKLFVNVALGWATAGVGNLLGRWAASLFGGITSGAMSDWDPLSTIMGAAAPFTGDILKATGVSGVVNKVLPSWASSNLIPKSSSAGFTYGLSDVAKSAGMTSAKELLSKYKDSLQPQDLTDYGNPFAPGASPATTPSSFRPTNLPVLPYEQIDVTGSAPQEGEEEEDDRLPTPFAMGGAVSDMSNDDFINSVGGSAMYGDARKELEALMAQQQMPTQPMMGYADGGMVDDPYEAVMGYAAGGTADSDLPSYLGSPADLGGNQVSGFYNIDPRTFPFWKMRNQFDQGVYTPGRPSFKPFNVNNPQSQAGVTLPRGRVLYGIDSDMSTGYSRDPLAQEMMRRQSFQNLQPSLDPNNYANPRAYNRAMRAYARRMEEAGAPLMAYYDPRFSAPRPRAAQPVGNV